MTMKEIAVYVGVEDYPENFDIIYTQIKDDATPACDMDLIHMAQEKYRAFGEHYDLVRTGAEQINADPICSAWVKVVYTFLSGEKWGSYRDIPVTPMDGTAKQDMLMIATLIPFIPVAAEKYAKGGFAQTEIADFLGAYGRCLNSTRTRSGHLGLDQTYFRWLHLFAFAEIFRVHGIQFEFTSLKKSAAFLRNKQTGQILPVSVDVLVHASGKMLLGAGGYEDSEGAFQTTFSEDEENFYAYGVYDHIISPVCEAFSKTKWECIGRPGDKCLAMHLPRGADIREDNVRRACAAAFDILARNYPQYVGVPVQCGSWLLDPGIETLVGADSNVVRFGKLFARYPGKSSGRACNSFVFPGRYQGDEDLPEDTRLQRAMKQNYLNGGYSYSYTGILVLN